MTLSPRRVLFAALSVLTSSAVAAGHLSVQDAWIASAPPGVHMLAGYATLKNDGDQAIVIIGAQSDAFGSATLHQSTLENGVEHMQALGDVTLAAGQTFVLAPDAKHLMLMMPKRDLADGDSVDVRFQTKDGASVAATFRVRPTPVK